MTREIIKLRMEFADSKTNALLKLVDDKYVDQEGRVRGEIINGIPRFVPYKDNYAKSFGWQWNKYENNRSESRGSNLNLKHVIYQRTQFEKFGIENKSILECGMGGGDDTEVLCTFPFSEIWSFDLSYAVDRAKKFIKDPRVRIFQASIFEIPVPDESFDVVYCHRVLQHTPDPKKALTMICKKVKKGGLLFAHAYKNSPAYMSEWRYKYRWLTKRLPLPLVRLYVDMFGPLFFWVNRRLYHRKGWSKLAYQFIPFYNSSAKGLKPKELLELNKLITFDALTPWFDAPMKSEEFFGIIENEGFKILNKHDPETSPMWCTAVRL